MSDTTQDSVGQDDAEQGGAEHEGARVGGERPDARTPAERAFDNRFKLIAAHLLIASAVFALWAAADAWFTVTGLGAATLLSLLTALVAGLVLTTLVHEWFHYLGARWCGAAYSTPERIGLFVFDFDFASNSVAQFRTMSWAGQAGSWVAVIVLFLALPMDNPGRVMLVCAAIGSAVFAGLIEIPVLNRAAFSGNPLAELSRIDRAGLYRSARIATGVTLVLWLLAV